MVYSFLISFLLKFRPFPWVGSDLHQHNCWCQLELVLACFRFCCTFVEFNRTLLWLLIIVGNERVVDFCYHINGKLLSFLDYQPLDDFATARKHLVLVNFGLQRNFHYLYSSKRKHRQSLSLKKLTCLNSLYFMEFFKMASHFMTS